jgi:hypothetical protein
MSRRTISPSLREALGATLEDKQRMVDGAFVRDFQEFGARRQLEVALERDRPLNAIDHTLPCLTARAISGVSRASLQPRHGEEEVIYVSRKGATPSPCRRPERSTEIHTDLDRRQGRLRTPARPRLNDDDRPRYPAKNRPRLFSVTRRCRHRCRPSIHSPNELAQPFQDRGRPRSK